MLPGLSVSPAIGRTMIASRTSTFPRRWSSSAASGSKQRKIVIVGAGFLGSYIAKALVADSRNRIVLASRHPEKLHSSLSHLGSQLLPPQPLDVTLPSTLTPAFRDADVVISLVGLLTGTEKQFVEVQQKGGENVATAAKEAGVGKCIMISALGADVEGLTPYQRTKALAEKSFLESNSKNTIIRPSLVFGPGDSFFARFATSAKYLPFLPVFGGGTSRFQPVYAGDVAKAVEICSRDDKEIEERVGGKIVEAGGPEVFTYKQLMSLVLSYSGLSSQRLILSLPFFIGQIQGFFLEKLPETMFTVTRDQVTQLKADNIESPPSAERITIADLIARYPPPHLGSSVWDVEKNLKDPKSVLKSVHDILPLYIGRRDGEERENGKRKHGRGGDVNETLKEIKRMSKEAGIKTPGR